MSRPKRIAIICAGISEVHATSVNGNYATLCGLDGDDPDQAVKQMHTALKRHDRITCKQCYQIWRHLQQYTLKDFQ